MATLDCKCDTVCIQAFHYSLFHTMLGRSSDPFVEIIPRYTCPSLHYVEGVPRRYLYWQEIHCFTFSPRWPKKQFKRLGLRRRGCTPLESIIRAIVLVCHLFVRECSPLSEYHTRSYWIPHTDFAILKVVHDRYHFAVHNSWIWGMGWCCSWRYGALSRTDHCYELQKRLFTPVAVPPLLWSVMLMWTISCCHSDKTTSSRLAGYLLNAKTEKSYLIWWCIGLQISESIIAQEHYNQGECIL